MTIDRIDWHGEWAENHGFPYENGGTHIGMYLAWIIQHHLEGEFHQQENSEQLEKVRTRQITGRQFLIESCDEKFWEEDLNPEAYEFTKVYYDVDNPQYFKDYDEILVQKFDLTSIFAVADTWENYDLIAVMISKRYQEWKQANLK